MIEPPTVATTRLDHIEANLAAIRRHVGDRAVLAAVKADAYGHGAVEVARHLQSTGAVDQFGVATVGEGIELRRAGITLPILKLSVARGPEVVAAVDGVVERPRVRPVTDTFAALRTARRVASAWRSWRAKTFSSPSASSMSSAVSSA